MILDLGKLSSGELKELDKAVKAERDRRGKKNPANHEAPSWPVPNKAVAKAGISFTTPKTKPLGEITAADVPRGLSPEDVALDY